MAGIIGRENNDLILELGGCEVLMSQMDDTQFADWVRLCVGLRPLSCGDDSRGRRNTNKPKKEPKRKRKVLDEELVTENDLIAATEWKREELPFRMKSRIIHGKEYQVKVYD